MSGENINNMNHKDAREEIDHLMAKPTVEDMYDTKVTPCDEKECSNCEFYYHGGEQVPYGETVDYIEVFDCTCDDPKECPAAQAYLKDELKDWENE